MNPNLCRVALRPRGPFEVFDLTLRFIRERARPLLWLSVCTVLPATVVCSFLSFYDDYQYIALLIAVGVAPLIHAPFTAVGGRLLFADDTSVRQGLWSTIRRPSGLVVTVGASVATWVLICTGVGVLALPFTVYLPETAILERVSLSRGTSRSSRLAAGQLGVATVAAIAPWALMLWGGLVGELSGQLLVGFVLQLGQPLGALEFGDMTPFLLAGILLSHPIYAIFRLLLYVDVRTRMEGWDLQVGLRALGIEGPR
ncbi:MAG: hypothetical protein AB8H79_06440 [Myxococcota bacterium]